MTSLTPWSRRVRLGAVGLALLTVATTTAAGQSTQASAPRDAGATIERVAPQPMPAPDVVWRTDITNLINRQRSARGLRLLTQHSKLTVAAQGQATYMARVRRLTHTGVGGTNAGQRITAAGYRWSMWGEVIAYGQSTPAAVVRAWMNSTAHRSILLNSRFVHIGVGVARDSRGTLWFCVDVARPA